MNGIDADLLRRLATEPEVNAWNLLVRHALDIASRPLAPDAAPAEVVHRDRQIGALDHFLSSAGWDLWQSFGSAVERTSQRLANWWSAHHGPKAVLILDGLSLRELPWLLQGAQARGYTLHGVAAQAAEIPGQTQEFARALGFSSRSQLQNGGAGHAHRLAHARTECVDLPWKDCEALVDSTPNWVFWHHWPDSRLHEGAGAGQGLDGLSRDAAAQLCSDDFWAFVQRLATGRRLVITSDHGYAATGYFADAAGDVAQYLKQTFASGRSAPGGGDIGPFAPPVALQNDGPHGTHRLALGRRKWRSPGGYPTLTHGGLTLLEMLSPWLELSRPGA
jgi:hypothetical protein